MMILTLIISGVMMVFSIGLMAISFLSYRKYRNAKLLFVSVVFFLFFIKGLITTLSVFLGSIPDLSPFPYSGFIDLAILLLLYLATLKR